MDAYVCQQDGAAHGLVPIEIKREGFERAGVLCGGLLVGERAGGLFGSAHAGLHGPSGDTELPREEVVVRELARTRGAQRSISRELLRDAQVDAQPPACRRSVVDRVTD